MAEEEEKYKRLTLISLYQEHRPLFSKVESLMQQHQKYDYIIQYLNSKGFTLSKGSLSNLKNKLREREETGASLDELMDKRMKASIKDIPNDKITGYNPNDNIIAKLSENEDNEVLDSPKVYSNKQVLDLMIQKGMRALSAAPSVDLAPLIKALDLSEKYYGDKTRGLTGEALKQYRLINEAQFNAMREVILRYFPDPEKQQEVLDEMDKVTNELLSKLGANEEGKALLQALRDADLDVG